MRRILLPCVLAFVFSVQTALACDSCGCALARISSHEKLSEKNKPWFFDFTFEQLVWHKRDPQLARELGDAGHDTHDKTTEEFYHFGMGAHFSERFSVFTELPYIVRHDLNVESFDDSDPDAVDHLGERRTSQGFGDLRFSGIFKLFKKGHDFIGPLAGIKFPTGVTAHKTPQGDKFEPEMQPGSGSFDPLMGAAFQYGWRRFKLHGNAIYTIRTPGKQDFAFGNLFSSYVYVDYLVNPQSRFLNTKIGFDTAVHNERKQRNAGGPIADSGGTTWLMGPEFSMRGNDWVSVFGNVLFPVYQDLGGIHQKLQYVWNVGTKISF